MWSSHATHRAVPYTGLHARQPHRAVLLHTNGGGTDHGSLYGWWASVARKGQHVGAHFQVMTNGHAEQYVDTDQVIYHAYGASEWAVGIETEDDGHPERPWTDAQLAAIVAICREMHIPGRILTSPQPADGLGWHEQFVDWNHDGHQCPGHVREQQIRRDILPALLTAPPTPPAPHIEGDDVLTMYLDPRQKPEPVWIANGFNYRWVQTAAERDHYRSRGVPLETPTAAQLEAILKPLIFVGAKP